MWTIIAKSIKSHRNLWFLCSVLLFVNLYSFYTLATKPAFWYDEAINVELARNFSDFGKLDLVIAPHTFSGKGATVGSTGYPVTLPLAGFFRLFGFGLTQARLYMLFWMSAFLVTLFLVSRKLWGVYAAYGGVLLIATFAPFYGNGRSVMGEIPGFLFFLLSFYLLEQRKWCLSGILLGLSVVSKPSVFIFLLPAYVLVLLCLNDVLRNKLIALLRLSFGSLLALLPWLVIYADEITRGGLAENILNHFRNPYQEAGIDIWTNISHNLWTFFQSTTLLYFTVLLVLAAVALYRNRELFRAHRSIFILSVVYIPLAFFQYLKSFGYLRYLIAAEFLTFILFLIALPVLVRWALGRSPFGKGSTSSSEEGFKSSVPNFSEKVRDTSPPERLISFPARMTLSGWSLAGFRKGGIITGAILIFIVLAQVVHLFWFSDLYPSEKAQKTLTYLSSAYPDAVVGVMNVPQVGSLLAPDRKYQYLSTYGLWRFGVNPLLLPPEQLPPIIVADADDPALTLLYEKDTAFSEGFTVYKKR